MAGTGSGATGGPIYDIRDMEAELFPQKTKKNPLVLVGASIPPSRSFFCLLFVCGPAP